MDPLVLVLIFLLEVMVFQQARLVSVHEIHVRRICGSFSFFKLFYFERNVRGEGTCMEVWGVIRIEKAFVEVQGNMSELGKGRKMHEQ